MENKLVNYLNTLHSYTGHNANVFAEKNVNNEFYKEIMVDVPLTSFIIDQLYSQEPHIIMLTGHAGDGKTSLMYHVLSKLGCTFDSKEEMFEVTLSDNKKVMCIKDFSEFPDSEKESIMQKSKTLQDQGTYVFMVANTGPLINTFVKMFPEEKRIEAENKFIDAMDVNTGKIVDIGGFRICLINIVNVDNSYFGEAFLNKIIMSTEWTKCATCPKKGYCHIFRNVNLLKENRINTLEFIKKYYIWQNEYGSRLTIRSMTQQLAFMLTGGFNCEDVIDIEPYKYLYSNLFFGYIGTKEDQEARKIYAISESNRHGFDKRRLRVDEKLFVEENYATLFSDNIKQIILDMFKQNGNISGTDKLLRRMFFFYNIKSDLTGDYEDIFSKQFERYVKLKYSEESPNRTDHSLVRCALNMIYTGIANENDASIPVTFNRETGYTQNVQYVIGSVRRNKVQLKKTEIDQFDHVGKKYSLIIQVEGKQLKQEVNLPLLDYFEDLKNGIINTNIDAQLSKGIENIKSEILDIVLNDVEEGEFSLIVLKNGGFETKSFSVGKDSIG